MFKATLTAILLSSVAIVPAATIAVVASVDTAHAKSENAGGNGGGKGGGNSGSKGGKSSSAKSKSDTAKSKAASSSGSKGKSKARSTGNDPVGKFLRKITGQDKKTAKAKVRTTRSAAPKVAKATVKPEKGPMHPSNLGKMNGALNANVNAVIAHVKNGNTNGPVGGLAAMAVAGYAAEGAAETLAIKDQYSELDQLLIDNGYTDADGNPDIQAYRDALEETPANGTNDAIEAALANEDAALSLEDALKAENNGVRDFANVAEYEAWRDGTEGADPIDRADTLITDLEGVERPSDEDIETANTRIEDRTAAEDNMLSIWNKGDGDDTVRSEAEEELLTALYDRIEADGDALTDAIEEHADLPEPIADDPEEDIADTGACELETGCDDDIVAIAE